MSWTFNTGCRYHTQDTGYYCGAACAMMVLHEIGVPYAALDQDDLYTSNHDHNVQSGWATDPYGLGFTLNDRRPASFLPNFFVVHKRLTEAQGTLDVAFTLYHYHVSPAILVYHCAHWNVVRGVQTDVDPASGPYVVEGFWLNNPVWDSTVGSHDDADTCGSGGGHGVANEFVTYGEWQTNRFNGCAYDDPGGATQWISVCDPEPATFGLPRRRETRYRSDGRHIIRVQDLSAIGNEGLKEYRVPESQFGERVFRTGKFGTPLLVQRLDVPNQYYYILPWEQRSGVLAMVDVDARFGVFKSARIFSEAVSNWIPGGTPAKAVAEIERRINDKRFELAEERGRIRVFPGTYCISQTLVWKPCRESWSPHLPFYHVQVGGHSLYVRIDGPVFTGLTSGRGV